MLLYRAMIRLRVTIPLEGNWATAQEKVRKKAFDYAQYLVDPYSGSYPLVEMPEHLYDGYSNPRKGWAPLAAFGDKSECRRDR